MVHLDVSTSKHDRVGTNIDAPLTRLISAISSGTIPISIACMANELPNSEKERALVLPELDVGVQQMWLQFL